MQYLGDRVASGDHGACTRSRSRLVGDNTTKPAKLRNLVEILLEGLQ